MILSLKRWERVGYEVAPGVTIHMKLKRLKRHEAKPLQRAMISVFRKWEEASAKDLTPSQRAEILVQVYEQIPEDQLKALFSDCVKEIEDFEIDGNPVNTGPALLEEADDQLMFWLLLELNNRARLSVSEGKASASPSLLPATQVPEYSDSPATSTGNGNGLTPSGVTVEAGVVPSIVGAEARTDAH